MANTHDGHRDRMRERIMQNGLSTLQYHEILEFILYAFVPMKDTNPIAHDLIDQFGSFANVLNANYDELAKVKGVTKNAALFISTLPDMARKYLQSFECEKIKLDSRGAVKNYMSKYFVGKPKEIVVAAAFDVHNNLLGIFQVAEGWSNSVNCTAREIVEIAIRSKAFGIVIAHNHPSGVAVPSDADFFLTNAINCALELVGVTFYDHLIFGKNDYYSFEQNGLFEQYSKNLNSMLKDGSKFYDKPSLGDKK